MSKQGKIKVKHKNLKKWKHENLLAEKVNLINMSQLKTLHIYITGQALISFNASSLTSLPHSLPLSQAQNVPPIKTKDENIHIENIHIIDSEWRKLLTMLPFIS